MLSEGLLLGFSTGTYCAVSCAPAAIPFIFSEKITGWKQNAGYVSLMLLGRLIAYIAVGFIVGAAGGYAVQYLDPGLQRKLLAIGNTSMGLLMIAAGLMYNFPSLKLCRGIKRVYRPQWASLAYGIFTGLNICPPFFLAASRVFGRGSGLEGVLYFLMFFVGTSVYFLPLLGVHLLDKHLDKVRMVARLTLILLGIYFFLAQGLFLNVEGAFQ